MPGTEVLKVIIIIIAIIVVQFFEEKFEEKWIIALEIEDFSVEEIAFVPIASFWNIIIGISNLKSRAMITYLISKECYNILRIWVYALLKSSYLSLTFYGRD